MIMKIKILITSLLLAGYVFGVTCPVPVSCPVLFEHDPNLINFRVVFTHTMFEGQVYIHDFNSCDPDDDNGGFIHELLTDNVFGITCTPEGKVTFIPASKGIFYADFQVTDIPIADDPNTDKGTIVFRVLPRNKPPVLGGCK